MEELAGDVTAIGAVTQESGERIGTALRTIYSRITTIDASKEVLEDLGIAMYEMGASGPEIRSVSDILGDLSKQWNDLTDEQRQNIGVTIAGRARLSQFLALMNNYQMSIDATTSAYNSQGSAMREQEQYMQSYEYQFNVLGSTVTELALTIEDKLVGDALYLLTTTAIDLLEILNDLMNRFGVLPTLLSGGATALMFFNGNLSKTHESVLSLLTNMGVLASKLMEMDGSFAQLAGSGIAKLSGGIGKLISSFGKFGSLLSGGLVVGGIFLVAKAIENLVGKMAEARRANEEAERSFQNSIETLNNNGNNVNKLIDRYEELNTKLKQNADSLSNEEQMEYNGLINELSTIMPEAVSHIDASGQVHLKNADAMRESTDRLQALAAENAEYVKNLGNEEFDEHFEKLDGFRDRYQKNQEEIEKYRASLERQAETLRKNDEITEKYIQTTLEQSKVAENLRKAESQNLALKYELHGLQQQTLLMIGDQVNAYMGATGAYENVTSAGQALVSQYTQQNEAMIENMHTIEDEAERIKLKNEVYAESEKVSQAVSEAYNHLAENLNGINTEEAIQEFDNLIQALPAEALEGEADQVSDTLNKLSHAFTDVMNGKNVDSEQLVRMLEEVGIGSNEARQTVERLGQEFNNQSIKSAVAKEELTSYNDELTHTKELALETIDPLSKLFGVESDSTKAMDTHIQTLQILRQQYGETWHEMEQGEESIEILANTFDVSEKFIVDNLDEIGQAIRALNTATVEWSDESQSYVWKFDDSVTESTKNLINNLINIEDASDSIIDSYVKNTGLVKHSQEELTEMTGKLNERFKEFGKAPKEDRDSWNLLLTELKGQLEQLYGQFIVVDEGVEGLKFKLADGTESEYFNNLTEKIKESGLNIELTEDKTTELIKLMAEDNTGGVHQLAVINEMAQDGTFAIEKTEEALRGLIDASSTREDRETFISILNGQLGLLEDDLIVTKDEADNLILAFEDPSISSPWVDALNQMVKELGLEVGVTENMAGDFVLSIQTQEGETIFTQTTGQVKETKEEIEKTDKKVDEVTQKEREPINMFVDKTDVDEKTEEADSQVDEVIEKIRNPIGVHLDKSDVDEKKQQIDSDLNNLVANPFSAYLDLDKNSADEKADEAKGTLSDLEKERIAELKLNIDEDGFNNTVQKVNDLRGELSDIEVELTRFETAIQLANEQMGALLDNTKNINYARTAISKLKDETDEAIAKIKELYDKFASGEVNTSGFENSVERINKGVNDIEGSVARLQKAVLNLNKSMVSLNSAFSLSSMKKYAEGISGYAVDIESRMIQLSGIIRSSFSSINNSFSLGNARLRTSVNKTSDDLGQLVILYRLTKEMVIQYIEDMGIAITDDYIKTVNTILKTTTSFDKSMEIAFNTLSKNVREQMATMGTDMISVFKDTTDKIKESAQKLPKKIGDGIEANMSKATGSVEKLAKKMVSKFKSELGIHSPSRVFEGLGGDVIDGLVNGLSGSDIKNLGQSVFSDFSDGAISTIDQIKGHMTFSPVTSGSFGRGFRVTSGFGPRRSPGGIGSRNHMGVDYAAPMGTPIPSQSSGRVVASGWLGGLGNAVIVESSRGIRHVYGHNSRNYVRVGQTVGKGQILGAVGSTGNSTGPHVHYEVRINGRAVDPRKKLRGFAKGGFVDKEELAFVGEEGLEAIIPLMPHRRERGLDLWTETGEILGMNSELLRMLINSQKRSGVFSSGGGFKGLDGEAGSGETSTATSGTIAPDYSSIMRSLGTADQPMFSGMASKEKPEALYKRDMHAINVGRFSSMLTKANIELSALMKNTLKYRNALEEVNYQEKRLRDEKQKQLSASVKRQSQIEKELGKLRNTSKHTADQRKKYNELQQEFDKNSESIMSLENEIRKMNISMDERKIEVYADYIGQITKGFDDLTKAINKTTSDLKFSLDYLTLTDENNIGGQLKIQYDILKESIRLEKTLMNNVNKLQSEYDKAVSKYGKNSKQAILAREELYSAESKYQSSVLDRVKLENTISKTREDVANEGIQSLKDYYKQTQIMTERAIDLEKKALEKQHQDKMSMYDDEIAKIESVYDARISEMDAQEEEDAYNNTMSELNTQRAELMQQISRATRDTSLEGRKRLAELQSQLGEINSEIEKTQKERQDKMYRDAIERQKQEQIQAVEMQKEKAEKEQEIKLESLNQELIDAQKYAERMINDDAMWDRLRNEFISGNGTGLEELTNAMTEQMSKFMSGDFTSVSMGYGGLSDDDKKLFSEDTLLEISNLMLKSSEAMERFVSTANERVQNIGNISGGDYSAGSITTGKTGNISTQAKPSPNIPAPPKPAPKPVKDNRTYTVKKGDTLWDLAQKYYGNPYQWTKIAQANANPDPRKLQIGRKLIIPFDTGGLKMVHIKDFELLELPKAS